jgi:hypothetical protein
MYQFGTVVLLGLVVAAVVELVRHLGTPRSARAAAVVRPVLALGLGVLLGWALDYSMFAAWGVRFREPWMGTVTTGLVIGGVATFWYGLLALVSSIAQRRLDDRVEIETRIPRAA